MADVKMRPQWMPWLSSAEFNLVTKALCGRLGPDDVAPANQLGERLIALRYDRSKDLERNLRKNRENVRHARD